MKTPRRDDEERETEYPLLWPQGWPRTPSEERRPARFRMGAMGATSQLSIAEGRLRVLDELERLGASEIVISSNFRAGREPGDDRGVAVYFSLNGVRSVLACDRWDRIAGNLGAIAAHVDAIRGQQRWGVGSMAQAFAGYKALPAVRNWWEILGVPRGASPDVIKAAKRELLTKHHPDRGGDPGQAAEITAAYAAAVEAGAVR